MYTFIILQNGTHFIFLYVLIQRQSQDVLPSLLPNLKKKARESENAPKNFFFGMLFHFNFTIINDSFRQLKKNLTFTDEKIWFRGQTSFLWWNIKSVWNLSIFVKKRKCNKSNKYILILHFLQPFITSQYSLVWNVDENIL